MLIIGESDYNLIRVFCALSGRSVLFTGLRNFTKQTSTKIFYLLTSALHHLVYAKYGQFAKRCSHEIEKIFGFTHFSDFAG